VCYISGFATHYSGTVTSVATADGGPIVPTTTQDIVVKVQPHGATPSGEQTITISAYGFNVFDSRCTGLNHAEFAVGDEVSVFLDNSGQYMPDAIVNFSHN
jgi:hypothetical protein